MRLSVIVPVYNGEKYIAQCLDSLLAQTVDDMEILVVNDGSNDSTQKIVEGYGRRDGRITLVCKENQGLPQARKTGVECAQGEYVGFVDADDWVEPEMFRILLTVCIDNDAQIACSGFFVTTGERDIPSNRNSEKQETVSGEKALIWLNRREKIFPYAWNKVYKKEVFQCIDFPEGNFVGEDYVTIIQVLCKAERVVWIPKPLYHYVQIENSMCHGGYSDKYIVSYQNYVAACDYLSKCFPKEKEYFENYFLTETASFIVAMGKNSCYNQEMISDVVEYARKHLWQYLKAKYINKKYKLGVLAICLNYRLLVGGYKMIAWLQRKSSVAG